MLFTHPFSSIYHVCCLAKWLPEWKLLEVKLLKKGRENLELESK